MKTSSTLILYGVVGYFVYKLMAKKSKTPVEDYFAPESGRDVRWTIEYELDFYRDVVWRRETKEGMKDVRYLIGDRSQDDYDLQGSNLTMPIMQNVGREGNTNRKMRRASYWTSLPEAVSRLDYLASKPADPSRPELPPSTYPPNPGNPSEPVGPIEPISPKAQDHLDGWGFGSSQPPNMSW